MFYQIAKLVMLDAVYVKNQAKLSYAQVVNLDFYLKIKNVINVKKIIIKISINYANSAHFLCQIIYARHAIKVIVLCVF